MFDEKNALSEINDFKEIQPGDILFFFKQNTFSGKIVKFVQQFHSHKYAHIIHTAVCLDKNNDSMPIIGHLTPFGFKTEAVLQKFMRQGTQDCIVMRLAEIEELDRYRCLLIEAMEKSREAKVKYDKHASFFSIFHIDTCHANPKNLKKSICSSIITKCLINAGVPGFEKYPINILPVDLYRACKKNNLFLKLNFSADNELALRSS